MAHILDAGSWRFCMGSIVEITPLHIEAFEITGQPRLDPVRVILQDITPGTGRLIVECYGVAWSAFWNAMSGKTLRQFVSGADAAYITSNLWPQNQKRTKVAEQYLRRIVDTVIAALKEPVP